jgi:undecaprenyl-diphosphatase
MLKPRYIEFAHRFPIRHIRAWALAFAILAAALYSAVRYQPFVSANVDWPILLKVNHYYPSALVNKSIIEVSDLPILTGALFLALSWYLWFATESHQVKTKLLLGLGGAVIAVILSRRLQIMLPVHLRPVNNPMMGFNIAPGIDPATLNGWSSFPSDHACLYFALAAVLWRQSRELGIFGLMLALLGSLPRIYYGIHYPTDVLFGALLGITLVVLVQDYGPEKLTRRAVLWEHHRPGLFYFCGFLFSYEIATLFNDIRQIGNGLSQIYQMLSLSKSAAAL